MGPSQLWTSTLGAQASLPQRGEIFDGSYRIEGVIGTDVMGALLAATRLENNERVAIKVLLPDGLYAPDVPPPPGRALGRSTLQGVGSSKLRIDFIARSAEAGICQGRPYLVLEYAAGMDPRELVDQGGIHRSRPPPPPAFPPARAVPPIRASERLAAPAPARAAVYPPRTSVPTVPMRSAAPGYLLAGMALVAISATAGWAVWHQSRALHQAEARTEAPTLAPTVKLPAVPALLPAPSAYPVVTTTGAVVSGGSVQAPPTPVSPSSPPAPVAASPAPAPAPRHHHHARPKPAPTAHTSAPGDPYATSSPSSPPASPLPASSPASPQEPGAGTDLFDIRK